MANWSWRFAKDEYGIVGALTRSGQFDEEIKRDRRLQAALAQIEMAEIAIDAIMDSKSDDDDA